MRPTVQYEPNRLSAGILALLVHGLFFALLYFGLNWNQHAYLPATMTVQLWSSLPDQVVAPPVPPKIEVVPPPPQPEKIVKPDIVIPEKKKPVPVLVEVPKPKLEIKKLAPKVVKPQPDKAKPVKPNPEAVRKAEQQAAQQKAEQAKLAAQAEQAAEIGRVVDEYQAKIQAKIRRNIFMPPNVAKDALAIFRVTLLPGGSVLNAVPLKSSGNAAYDDAVHRAILKSDPLPLPPDVTLFHLFRQMTLTFKPSQ
jgi:colicin import membrane protein